MKKKKSVYMKKREIDQGKMLLEAYGQATEVKKKYIKEITEKLIKNKIHVGNMTFRKLETLKIQNRLIQFSISDMIGIEKVEIKEFCNITKEEIDSQNFLSFKDKMQEYILKCIDNNKSFKINFHLLNLKNYRDFYNNRDSFASNLEENQRSRIVTNVSSTTNSKKRNSFDLDSFHKTKTNSVTEQKYIKIIRKYTKKKRLIYKLKKQLKKAFIPGPLKYQIYEKIITDYNSIDVNFYNYYKNLDVRMPVYMKDIIYCNVKTIFCSFNYFNVDIEIEISMLLKLFYNYRSDIGYKQGMEVYALILSQELIKHPLLKIFCFLMLDLDLIFAVFKGDQILLYSYQRKVYDSFYCSEEDKMKDFVLLHKELIMQFFAYSVSVFFSYCFCLKNLKGLMDMVIVYKGNLFVKVYEIIFRFVELKELKKVHNCFQLAKIVGKKIKYKKEDFIIKKVRNFNFKDN